LKIVPSVARMTMLGRPGEPKARKVSLFRSIRDGRLKFCERKNSAALERVSSAVANGSIVSTGRTTMGKPLCAAQSEKCSISRNVFQQGAHQEAQKSSKTTEPLSSRRETFSPVRFSNAKPGAGLPVGKRAASRLVRSATATRPFGSKEIRSLALPSTFGAHSPETLMNTSFGAPG